MRSNLPVSHQEYRLPSDRNLVSTTDLKGRILHCNAAFVEVSGFTRDELLGQPHNLIRHPDMPAEAFRDMWTTIASGQPWSGMVKNRRKNGDHYWVLANVTPLMENGQPVAYMSVRSRAARPQIEAAEALYAQMRQEQQTGALLHTLHHGELQRSDWPGRLRRLSRALPWLGRACGYLAVGGVGLGLALAGIDAWLAVGAITLAACVAAALTQQRLGRSLVHVEH
ncbi:MAG: PAS domain-containing hybrid sensor histidine kinase/response regulator, partial [Rubrivivax sp.]